MVIPGVEMYKVLLGKGARVLDPMKTPSGHLALEADEYERLLRIKGRCPLPVSYTHLTLPTILLV
eukprot:375614-Pyramimonas_sp.AAC.1